MSVCEFIVVADIGLCGGLRDHAGRATDPQVLPRVDHGQQGIQTGPHGSMVHIAYMHMCYEYCMHFAVLTMMLLGELRVDVLNGVLSDNKARYHRPTGFTALLEITKHMLLGSPIVLQSTHFVQYNLSQSSNPLIDFCSYIEFIYLYGEFFK